MRVRGQEDEVCSLGERFDVGGIVQASGADVAAQNVFQVALVIGDVAISDRLNGSSVFVVAGDRGAEIGKAGRDDRA